jgi:hypothetical protein
MDLAADIALFYAGFPAVDVTYTPAAGGASVSKRAIFEREGIVVINGDAQAVDYSLRYPTASFPSVKKDDFFAVTGEGNFKARTGGQQLLDGFESAVPLAKA